MKTIRRTILLSVLTAAVAAILYFGLKAAFNRRDGLAENAFAMSLEQYREINPDLIQYQEIQQIPLKSTLPTCLAIDQGGRLLVGGSNSAEILTASGRSLRWFDLQLTPYSITGDDDRLYFGHFHVVRQVDLINGSEMELHVLERSSHVVSLARVQDALLMGDAGKRQIVRLELKSGEISLIDGRIPGIASHGFIIPSPYFDVCSGPDSTIWAVNPGMHMLLNFAADGQWLTSWQHTGTDVSGFCGCCNPAHIAVTSDGKIFTSEKGILRIKRYSTEGLLEAVVAGPNQFHADVESADIAVDVSGKVYVLDSAMGCVRVFDLIRHAEKEMQ